MARMMLLASFTVLNFYAASAFRLGIRAGPARAGTRSVLDDALKDAALGPSEDEGPQLTDAAKANFKMPEFDEIARVRRRMLETAGCAPELAKDACKQFRVEGSNHWLNGTLGAKSSTAQAGIIFKDWQDKKLGVKLAAFNKYAHKNANSSFSLFGTKSKLDAEMDFDEFSDMIASGAVLDKDENCKKVTDAVTPETPAVFNAVKVVTPWLKKNFNYGRYADNVAKDFISKSRIKQLKAAGRKPFAAEDIKLLAIFAQLDTDQNGVLAIKEAQPCLPATEADAGAGITEYKWKDVAHLENSDFGALNFPSDLTNNVLKLSSAGDSFTKADYDRLKLQKKLTDFIRLSKKPMYVGNTSVGIQDQLRFHQVAEIFPITPPDDRSPTKLTQEIHGVDITLDIPTIKDVVGRTVLEVYPEMLKAWLENGRVGNTLTKGKYADRLANDVVAWGDGVKPGTKGLVHDREGNSCLQGKAAGKDKNEWREVAPRLALFLALDKDGKWKGKDGKLTFEQVYPYLDPHDPELFKDSVWTWGAEEPLEASVRESLVSHRSVAASNRAPASRRESDSRRSSSGSLSGLSDSGLTAIGSMSEKSIVWSDNPIYKPSSSKRPPALDRTASMRLPSRAKHSAKDRLTQSANL